MIDENQLPLHVNIPAVEGVGGTRTSHRWSNRPGNLDTCNLRSIWPSVGPFDIPPLEGTDFEPSMLAAWHLPAQRMQAAETEGALHFFLDDYRFERVWKHPDKTFDRVEYVGAALTPDFSLYIGAPYATQIWQTYRQRWMGAFWQYNGITVIPAVRWGEPNTFDFVFEGLPYGGTVAIGTFGPGSHDAGVAEIFVQGMKELIARVNPSKLLIYGKMVKEAEWLNLPPIVEYETFWATRSSEIAAAKSVAGTDEQKELELCPNPLEALPPELELALE